MNSKVSYMDLPSSIQDKHEHDALDGSFVGAGDIIGSFTDFDEKDAPEEATVRDLKVKAKKERARIQKSIKFQRDRLKKIRREKNDMKLLNKKLPDLNIGVSVDPLPESVLISVENARLYSKCPEKDETPILSSRSASEIVEKKVIRKDGAEIIRLNSLNTNATVPDEIKNFRQKLISEKASHRRRKAPQLICRRLIPGGIIPGLSSR